MSNHHEDEEIRKLLKSFRASRPPEDLLKNYEQEVLRKVHAAPGHGLPAAGAFALAACGLGLLALGIFLIGPRLQTVKPAAEQSSAEAPVRGDLSPQTIPDTAPSFEAIPKEMSPAAEAAELSEDDAAARDLLILEMLGEDEGLVDGFDRMAADSEFWTPPAAGSMTS